MVWCYQSIKNKYEELYTEITNEFPDWTKGLKETMPDLDFMGWVWSETKVASKKQEETKLASDTEYLLKTIVEESK